MEKINLLRINTPIFRELCEFPSYNPFYFSSLSIRFMSTIIPIK